MIKKTLTVSVLLLLGQAVNLSVLSSAHAKVQKCQDAQGKWHYGNNLNKVCKNEADIQAVKERVKTPASTQTENASEKELTRLELRVLNKTEYLISELRTILKPYTTEQDVENRFERLKTDTEAEIADKETFLEGLQKKQQILSEDTSSNAGKSKLLLTDNDLRIKSTEADIRQLNVQLEQIEQRRTKVVSLFRQFKDKFNDEAATQQSQQG